jgi:hypothetical protein
VKLLNPSIYDNGTEQFMVFSYSAQSREGRVRRHERIAWHAADPSTSFLRICVEILGFDDLHAELFKDSRTRGRR